MKKIEELSNPNSCLNKASDDEYVFVLLERDVTAPEVVKFWIERRIALGKNKRNDPQIKEAREWIKKVRKIQKEYKQEKK